MDLCDKPCLNRSAIGIWFLSWECGVIVIIIIIIIIIIIMRVTEDFKCEN